MQRSISKLAVISGILTLAIIGGSLQSFAGERLTRIKASFSKLKDKLTRRSELVVLNSSVEEINADNVEVIVEDLPDLRIDFTRTLPIEMIDEILSYLSIEQLHEIHGSKDLNPKVLKSAEFAIKKEINKYLEDFILLPEVTDQDVTELEQILHARNETTSITRPMPAFRVAKSKTSIGLYRAVMGQYPDLNLVYFPSNEYRAEIITRWNNNPEIPATFTTSAEDLIFAKKLSQITGRKFSVMTEPQNEYSIRGRTLIDGNPIGNIDIHTHGIKDLLLIFNYFCMAKWPMFREVRGVHENPPEHWHSFGLDQPISDTFVRSPNGVLRGSTTNFAAFSLGHATSRNREGFRDKREMDVSFRLAEEVKPLTTPVMLNGYSNSRSI